MNSDRKTRVSYRNTLILTAAMAAMLLLGACEDREMKKIEKEKQRLKNSLLFELGYDNYLNYDSYNTYLNYKGIEYLSQVCLKDLTQADLMVAKIEEAQKQIEANYAQLLTEARDDHLRLIEILNEMEMEKEKVAASISKEFSDYYPILDLSKLPEEYAKYFRENEFSFLVGPDKRHKNMLDESHISSMPNLFVYKSRFLYHPDDSRDFFKESDADYKLHQDGNKEWQVIKTSKNGKVDKIQIFFLSDTDYTLKHEFAKNASDIKDGLEVHVDASNHVSIYDVKVLYKKTPNKPNDQYMDKDGKFAEKIKNLKAEYTRKLEKEVRNEEIMHQADSIVNKIIRNKVAKSRD